MWPVNVTGKPVIVTSHMCVDCTFVPSGRLMDMGFVGRLMDMSFAAESLFLL